MRVRQNSYLTFKRHFHPHTFFGLRIQSHYEPFRDLSLYHHAMVAYEGITRKPFSIG